MQSIHTQINSLEADQKHIVFVTGPYKSGTSLVTQLVEQRGFFNPASITNSNERGFNSNGGRYETRECSVARSISRQIYLDEKTTRPSKNKGIVGYFAMLENMTNSGIVLKLPSFLWTIDNWISKSKNLGFQVTLFVCIRDKDSLKRAWEKAAWTQNIMEFEPDRLDKMINKANEISSSASNGFKKHIVLFHELINYKNSKSS